MNIKGMDKNMQCRGFQFEIGKEYKIERNGSPLELCSDTVFHYCKSLRQAHIFYDCCNENNRYFEIDVLGDEVSDNVKCGSDHIKIVREIVGDELRRLKGLDGGVNTGVFNTGLLNNGDSNSGDGNSGSYNSGGDNSGNYNSGDCNSGNTNSGNFNSGFYNSGDFNSGNFNSGSCNSGGFNSGECNSGYHNTGIANKCNFSNGVFCNEDDTNIRIFNKPSGMSLPDFYASKYWNAICSAPFELTEWIEYTQVEKETDPKKELISGYLKTYTTGEAWANWWNKLSEENREIIKEIPNFDAEIFKDITGIEV